MKEKQRKGLDLVVTESILLLFILVLFVSSLSDWGEIDKIAALPAAVFGILVVLNVFITFATDGKGRYRRLAHLTFLLSVFMIFVTALVSGAPNLIFALIVFQLFFWGFYFVIMLVLYCVTVWGVYLARVLKNYKAALILFALLVILLYFYYLSGSLFHGYKPNDEIFLSFLSDRALLNGSDPYALTFPNQMINASMNGTTNSLAVTTSNTVMDFIDYPSLYFIADIPFYLVTGDNVRLLGSFDLSLEAVVFIIFMMVTIVLLMDRKKFLKVNWILIIASGMAIYLVASLVQVLMYALLLLAYVKIDRKYLWVILGVVASLQELAWIPVLLMIGYVFNNYGLKNGIRTALGTILLFLALNYFIFLNPSAYINDIFGPVSRLLLPNATALFGYAIVTNYGTLLGTYTYLFYIATAAILLLFLYLNDRKLIFLLSMLPFLFLAHGLNVYFGFFVFLFIVTLYIPKKKEDAGHFRTMQGGKPTFLYLSMGLLFLLSIFLINNSHQTYSKNFDVMLTNQSLYLSGKNITYTADLSYHHLGNNTLYFAVLEYGNFSYGFRGFINDRLLPNALNCTDYPCDVNVNRIILDPNQSSYHLVANLGPKNWDGEYYFAGVLYNGQYYYLSSEVYNSSI